MIDLALKNIFRHKTRSFLTILGIALGIGLVLALGSIGAGLQNQIQSQFASRAALISVSAASDSAGISTDTINGIQSLPGVASAIPIGTYRVTTRQTGGFTRPGGGGGDVGGIRIGGITGGAGGFFQSTTFTGINPSDLGSIVDESIGTTDGRKLDTGDSGAQVVLLGSTVATNKSYNVGDTIEYDYQARNSSNAEQYYFTVIGILQQTNDNTVDNSMYVPLDTMQTITGETTITDLRVASSDISLVQNLTTDIPNYFSDVRASSTIAIINQLESSLNQIQLAVYGIAGISILVGGLGIMNTMIMSVMERKREIGVMKAIGATTFAILKQVIQESAMMSVIGGLGGLSLGYLAVYVIPRISTFNPILTPELMAIGVGFALVLGIGAGIYPAWSASQLDPIEVLRNE